jgi:hypothetical protein
LRTHLDNKVSVSAKEYKKFDKSYKDAVTCLEVLYHNEFFIAGYSSGSVSIYST